MNNALISIPTVRLKINDYQLKLKKIQVCRSISHNACKYPLFTKFLN